MLLLGFLTTLMLLGTTDSLNCFRSNSLNIVVSNLTRDMLEEILNKQQLSDEFYCVASISYDSRSKQFTIRSNEDEWHKDISRAANIFLQFIVKMDFSSYHTGDIEDVHAITEVRLLCYMRPNCERELLLDFFDILTYADYEPVINAVYPLLLVEGERREECSSGKTLEAKYCEGVACRWEYSSRTGITQGRCLKEDEEDGTAPTLTIVSIAHIRELATSDDPLTTDYDRAFTTFRHALEFTCELNNCNKKGRGDIIYQTLMENYDIWVAWSSAPISGLEGEIGHTDDDGAEDLKTTTTATRTSAVTSTSSTTTVSVATTQQEPEQTTEKSRDKNSSSTPHFSITLSLVLFLLLFSSKNHWKFSV